MHTHTYHAPQFVFVSTRFFVFFKVVSGKGSILDKCGFAGSPYEERISTLKALMAYQVGLAGRPLVFMGAEFCQGREWSDKRSLDWHESTEDLRAKAMLFS
jgi:1,4-alpha-glucan branching enzyme